jgi:hypothetical protein
MPVTACETVINYFRPSAFVCGGFDVAAGLARNYLRRVAGVG